MYFKPAFAIFYKYILRLEKLITNNTLYASFDMRLKMNILNDKLASMLAP